MAPRLITLADAPTIRNRWAAYKTTAPEYADIDLSLEDIRGWVTNPRHHVAIDPATETIGAGITHPGPPRSLEVALLFTLTTGALAARNAADIMLAWDLQRAQAAGITSVWGSYLFPPAVDVDTTRALRYFDQSFGSTTTVREVRPDGTWVRIDADVDTLLAEVLAR